MEITKEIEDQLKREEHKLVVTPLTNSLDVHVDGRYYPCVNIEVWNDEFRVLIYHNDHDEPEIIKVGEV